MSTNNLNEERDKLLKEVERLLVEMMKDQSIPPNIKELIETGLRIIAEGEERHSVFITAILKKLRKLIVIPRKYTSETGELLIQIERIDRAS